MTNTANSPDGDYSDLANIPPDVRSVHHNVMWRGEIRGGRKTKVPYTPSGQHAAVDDPRTWTTFDRVREAYDRGGFDGIGFVLTRDMGITGIDLDYHRERDALPVFEQGGRPAPWALQIIEQLNSYTESSPSGQGIHILAKGTLPPGGRRRAQVEMYDSGRFLTVTGHHLTGTPNGIEARQDEISALHRQVFGAEDRSRAARRSGAPTALTDDDVIARAMRARNGWKFQRLWYGNSDGYPTPSEADLAFCGLLTFHTRDPDQIARVLFRSDLRRGRRAKLDRADYVARTINKALGR